MESPKTAKLVVEPESGRRFELPLDQDCLTIGRAEECDLVIDDQFASRRHAKVERHGDEYFLSDQGSRNGTLVGRTVLTGTHALTNYDEFRIGNTIIRFVEFGGSGATTMAILQPQATAIIFFADIANSTALTERLGDEVFRAKARELDGALRAIIRTAGGTPIEGRLLGDGVLAVFTSARQAIDSALRCVEAGAPMGLSLHLGMHAGDVIREDDNIFGGAVNIAARIASESSPGELLVSQTVRDLARSSAGVSFEDRGDRNLKGIDEPVRVFAVMPRGSDVG